MSDPDCAATSRLVDVTALQTALERFACEREWSQFHSPKNPAMALNGEVGELVELFQWLTAEASHVAGATPAPLTPYATNWPMCR